MTEEINPKNPGGGPEFSILRIYLKDVSFETPNSPAVFKQEFKQDINLQLNTSVNQLGDDTYEVTLRVTVTATQDEKTSFLIEVHQAGIFVLKGFDESQRDAMLGAYCPNTLHPFARETVADLVAKGGFPQLLLAPINFDALHAQKVTRAREQAAASESKGVQ